MTCRGRDHYLKVEGGTELFLADAAVRGCTSSPTFGKETTVFIGGGGHSLPQKTCLDGVYSQEIPTQIRVFVSSQTSPTRCMSLLTGLHHPCTVATWPTHGLLDILCIFLLQCCTVHNLLHLTYLNRICS